MRDHKEDFEPFLVDDVSFQRHLSLLSEDGTYAGNDSIVAFARLYNVTVVIHQLNEPPWQVTNDSVDAKAAETRELHVSYHNGDHYNSVRKANEHSNIQSPANISMLKDQGVKPRAIHDHQENLSDYENASKEDLQVQRVLKLSGRLTVVP